MFSNSAMSETNKNLLKTTLSIFWKDVFIGINFFLDLIIFQTNTFFRAVGFFISIIN